MNIKDYLNSNIPVLTDSGFETTLLFHHNIDLPHFASFYLLDKPKYDDVIYNYYKEHLEIAKQYKLGYILESGTWRANRDWGFKLGYNESDLVKVNQLAIKQLKAFKDEYSANLPFILISGQIGPAKDGYTITAVMSEIEAQKYHDLQIKAFKEAGADLASALTMGYINEALGIVNSAKENDLPIVISFTVETDGHLPSGETLKDAIETIDRATNSYPLHYMINCAHPSHFVDQLEEDGKWKSRIKAIRANASCKSHAELDEATELDRGDILDFGKWHAQLKEKLPNLNIYGGCCGSDVEHVAEICKNISIPVEA
ncbi:homocysteine S-methyltransferase family protein [Flavobacteriaceae bacterium MJ-SS4]|uniref:homocysteine S-methyltransferase family protein n=1 Tax=Gilvirhabdus luticola TaxID=3079858 RepID=UPI0032DCB7F2